jgi:hydrogenase maturation protease
MNRDLVKRIADAVLYEGYILYPYRASSIKNQQRFNFGVLFPGTCSDVQSGDEKSTMRTECLVEGHAPSVDVCVRFLHLASREVRRFCAADEAEYRSGRNAFEPVSSLEVEGLTYHTWQEAVEREVTLAGFEPLSSCGRRVQRRFSFGSSSESELLRDRQNAVRGILVRRQRRVRGLVTAQANALRSGIWQFCIDIENTTPLHDTEAQPRDAILMHAFASTHTILEVREGKFISLLDPGDSLADAARLCRNSGVFPVLVGEPQAQDTMLSSPIILYDYPQVAPESNFDFFDGTEIDEMLALRVLTLTEDEKRSMQSLDVRVRELLERTESLPPEHWAKLHGAIRGLRPAGSPSSTTVP